MDAHDFYMMMDRAEHDGGSIVARETGPLARSFAVPVKVGEYYGLFMIMRDHKTPECPEGYYLAILNVDGDKLIVRRSAPVGPSEWLIPPNPNTLMKVQLIL